jgi:hypothetical protein
MDNAGRNHNGANGHRRRGKFADVPAERAKSGRGCRGLAQRSGIPAIEVPQKSH